MPGELQEERHGELLAALVNSYVKGSRMTTSMSLAPDQQRLIEELLPLVRPLMLALEEGRVSVDDRTRSALSELHGDAANGWKDYLRTDAATVANIGKPHWPFEVREGTSGSSADVAQFRDSLTTLIVQCGAIASGTKR